MVVGQVAMEVLVLHDSFLAILKLQRKLPLVVGVHLLWSAPSCYEALEAFDEFLSCLASQQLQVDGSHETTCKQQIVGFPVSSFLANLVGNWTGIIDPHYLG